MKNSQPHNKLTNDEKIEEFIKHSVEKVDNIFFKCKACGFVRTSIASLKRHAEIHVKGLEFDCKFCEKQCKTTSALNKHISQKHKEQKSKKKS